MLIGLIADLFSESSVGHANHLDVGDVWMLMEERLDFNRVDVLAASKNHVLYSTNYLDVTCWPHSPQVSRPVPTRWCDYLPSFPFR